MNCFNCQCLLSERYKKNVELPRTDDPIEFWWPNDTIYIGCTCCNWWMPKYRLRKE